jgi:hypothetical protein
VQVRGTEVEIVMGMVRLLVSVTAVIMVVMMTVTAFQ